MQKNETFSSFCSRNIVDLKLLQSDWLRALWHGARNPYDVVHDRAGFSRKTFSAPKMENS